MTQKSPVIVLSFSKFQFTRFIISFMSYCLTFLFETFIQEIIKIKDEIILKSNRNINDLIIFSKSGKYKLTAESSNIQFEEIG
jgi:hypothetical protein